MGNKSQLSYRCQKILTGAKMWNVKWHLWFDLGNKKLQSLVFLSALLRELKKATRYCEISPNLILTDANKSACYFALGSENEFHALNGSKLTTMFPALEYSKWVCDETPLLKAASAAFSSLTYFWLFCLSGGGEVSASIIELSSQAFSLTKT